MKPTRSAQTVVGLLLAAAVTTQSHAVLTQVLTGNPLHLSSRKGFAKASADSVIINATRGWESPTPGTAWSWAIATTANGLDWDNATATGAGLASSRADSLSAWPPGHAWADGQARANPPRIDPTAGSTLFAASRARAGIGARGASAGDSMAGLIRFVVANLTVDPLFDPPAPGDPGFPTLSMDPEVPASVDRVGYAFFNQDQSTALELFRVEVWLTVAGGALSLGINDPTGTLTPAHFRYYDRPDGIGYELNAPVEFSVPFEFSHNLADGTDIEIGLAAGTSAASGWAVPTPSAACTILAGFALASRRRRPAD
jgi:hypothetical protein